MSDVSSIPLARRSRSSAVRRQFATAALALATAAALAACGGSSGGGDITGPPSGGVSSVSISPSSASIQVGANTTLSATPMDASGNTVSGQTITWSSDATGVATVNGSGVVTGVAAGTAHITAATAGKQAQATITVTPLGVASIALSATTGSVVVGSTFTLTATPKDANGSTVAGQTITWSSDATGVATVSSSGVVTGVAPGTANITASAGGKQATAVVTVTPAAVASVTLSANKSALLAFVADSVNLGTATVTATLKDASGNVLTGRTVAWASSDTNVAQVDANGIVQAIGAGTATITATSGGVSGSTPITVTLPTVAHISVTPAYDTVHVGQTTTLDVRVYDASMNQIISFSHGRTYAVTISALINQTGDVISAVQPYANEFHGDNPGVAVVTFVAGTIGINAQITVIP